MKLRITTGAGSWRPANDQLGLQVFYQSSVLTIEATPGLREIATGTNHRLFVAGSVVGWRTASGEVLDSDSAVAALALAANQGLAKCRDCLEGRYLLLLLGPDDSCELTADQFGQFEVCYQSVGQQVVFATDLSLLPISESRPEYDQVALAHTLLIHERRPPKRHTFYREVRRLGVGDLVRIRNGKADIARSRFRPAPVRRYGERELNEYTDLLLDAVRMRGSQRGNVVYLSSGWDSTAILACLVKLFGAGKVRAVIGRMQYSDRSGVINQFELDRAMAVAEYYRVPLRIVDFDYRHQGPELLDRLQPLLRAHQLSSLVALNHWQLAEFTAQTTPGDEAVFAGEISDGAHNLGFSQFVTMFHPVLDFREYADKMACYLFGPTFLKSFWNDTFREDAVYQFLRDRMRNALFEDPNNEGTVGRTRQLLAGLFLRSTRIPLMSLANRKLLTKQGRDLYTRELETGYLQEAAETVTPETLYSWYLHLYNSFHWQGSTVTPLWVTAEAQGLTMQVPFWDGRLQEFLATMPEDWGRGLDLNPTKYPLKWALKNRIDYPIHLQVGPHSYIYDVTPGFSLAAELLYASSFRDYFREHISQRRYRHILSSDVFDLDYVDGIVDRYLAGTEIRGAELSDIGALCWLFAVGCYGL